MCRCSPRPRWEHEGEIGRKWHKETSRYSFSKTPPLCTFLRARLDNWALTQSGIHLKVPWRFGAVAAARNKMFMHSWKSRGNNEKSGGGRKVWKRPSCCVPCWQDERSADDGWHVGGQRSQWVTARADHVDSFRTWQPWRTGGEEMSESERRRSAAELLRRSSRRGRLLLSLITFNYSSKRWIKIEPSMKRWRIKYSGNHLHSHLNRETSAGLVVRNHEVLHDTSLLPYFDLLIVMVPRYNDSTVIGWL